MMALAFVFITFQFIQTNKDLQKELTICNSENFRLTKELTLCSINQLDYSLREDACKEYIANR